MPKQSKKATNSPSKEIITWLSPVGYLQVTLSNAKVQSIDLVSDPNLPLSNDAKDALQQNIVLQLQEYFQKKRQVFDFPLDWNQGTPFQQRVWQALTHISYAQTQSYGDIARAIGQPTAVRAVGHAVGKNPWLIVVPCHRVIASSGRIGGFSSGIETKRQLLKLEFGTTKAVID